MRFADTTPCERVHRFEIGRLERLCPEPQHHWRRSRCLTRPLPGSHLGAFGKVDRRIEDHQVAALHPSVEQNLAAEGHVPRRSCADAPRHSQERLASQKSNGSNSPLQENILSHPFTIALQSTYNGIVCYDDYNIKIIPTCRNREKNKMKPSSKKFTASAATLVTFVFFAMTAPTVHADEYCITGGAQAAPPARRSLLPCPSIAFSFSLSNAPRKFIGPLPAGSRSGRPQQENRRR